MDIELEIERIERETIAACGITLTDDHVPSEVVKALVAAIWNEDLHPRGRDGRFINKFGFVKGVFNWVKDVGDATSPNAKGKKREGRAKIIGFSSGDGASSDNPWVKVEYDGPDPDLKGYVGFARAHDVSEAAASKARLDGDLSNGDDDSLGPDVNPARSVELDKPELSEDSMPNPRGDADEVRAYISEFVKRNPLSTTDASERSEALERMYDAIGFGSSLDTEKIHNTLGPNGDMWSEERKKLHTEMWDDLISMIREAGIPQDKDALALGGLPGAGKSFSLKPGQAASSMGIIPWEPEPGSKPPAGATHVSINPDIIKEMLIARGALPGGVHPSIKPMEQVQFIHEESSYLSKMFVAMLADEGYNIVLDNTMASPGSMENRMRPLREAGYSFRGLFVDIPVEESRKSARARYERGMNTVLGGRFVPSGVQSDTPSVNGRMSVNRDAFDELAGIDKDGNVSGEGWFREFMIIDNTGVADGKPKGEVTLRWPPARREGELYNTINDEMTELDPTVASANKKISEYELAARLRKKEITPEQGLEMIKSGQVEPIVRPNIDRTTAGWNEIEELGASSSPLQLSLYMAGGSALSEEYSAAIAALINGGETSDPEESGPITAAVWDEALHPRGRDGRFINKFGFVKGIFSWVKDDGKNSAPTSSGKKLPVKRAKIIGFSSEGASVNNPWVKVEYDGPDPDLKGYVGYARAHQVEKAAPEKASLNPYSGEFSSDGGVMPPDTENLGYDGWRSRDYGTLTYNKELEIHAEDGNVYQTVVDIELYTDENPNGVPEAMGTATVRVKNLPGGQDRSITLAPVRGESVEDIKDQVVGWADDRLTMLREEGTIFTEKSRVPMSRNGIPMGDPDTYSDMYEDEE